MCEVVATIHGNLHLVVGRWGFDLEETKHEDVCCADDDICCRRNDSVAMQASKK